MKFDVTDNIITSSEQFDIAQYSFGTPLDLLVRSCDLVTNVANKPLSAAQGVALKTLIDEVNVQITSLKNRSLTYTAKPVPPYKSGDIINCLIRR